MLKIFKISTLIAISFLSFAFQNIEESINGAIKTGNTRELVSSFASRVEIHYLGEPNVYSRDAATELLSDFFETHKPDIFTVSNSGDTESGITYVKGELTTTDGNIFQIAYYVITNNEKQQINQFNIDEPK